MKIGDLVRVPASGTTPSYIGLVVEEAGYKLTIKGGESLGVKSWDGTPGIDTWDRADLRVVERS